MPISIVSKWTGHYDSAFTQKAYVHASHDDPAPGRYRAGQSSQDRLGTVRSCERSGLKAVARAVTPFGTPARVVANSIATELAAATSGKHPDELVFTMPGGSVVRLSNWRRAVFIPARARAGTSGRFRVPATWTATPHASMCGREG
jgi:hypothetical protein